MLKKQIYLWVIATCLLNVTSSAYCQNVVNTCGTSFQTSTFDISINVGEPITNTLTASNFLFTQGFLQPITKLLSTTSVITNKNCDFQIFPNPTPDKVQVNIGTAYLSGTTFDLYDMTGHLIAHLTLSNQMIGLENLSNGTYILRMNCQDNEFIWKKITKAD